MVLGRLEEVVEVQPATAGLKNTLLLLLLRPADFVRRDGGQKNN